MVRYSLVLTLILLTHFGVDARAAEIAVDPVPIVTKLKSGKPEWLLAKKEAHSRGTTYRFARDGQQLIVSVTEAATETEAEANLQKLSLMISAPSTETQGVGEKCRIWTDEQSGITTLAFRRRSVMFHLIAPTKEEAVEVARQLDQSLKP